MVTKPKTRGLRHLALRVTDIRKSRAFYEELVGMRVVWEPDPGNVYLSSGTDNLALHQIPPTDMKRAQALDVQPLDHLGFIMESQESVDSMFKDLESVIERYGGKILKAPRRHRDDSYSFYMADPDGNVVQMLFEPTISAMEFVPLKQD